MNGMTPPDELLNRLRPVTGPELTPAPPVSHWPFWIAVTLVAMLIVGVVLFWPRRRRVPALAPEVEAQQALDNLAAEPSSESLDALDQLVRTFIRRVHAVDAARLTTPELLALLPTNCADACADALVPCDHARYSGMLPTQTAYAAMVRSAATLIQAGASERASA
jgi:hypothetical protein